VDLTSAGNSGSINNAYFLQVPDQSTGTGVITPFVRIQQDGSEGGYNTDAVTGALGGDVLDNKTGIWTHSITLGAIPKVKLTPTGGVEADYRAFLLDINQTGGNPLLSLNEIQLFVGGAGNQNVETFTSGVLDLVGAALVCQMDAGGDNQVKLNADLNSGSGSGDMFFYVLDSLFTGYGASANITLYSQFGSPPGDNASNDGFEEWAVRGEGGGAGPTPPPPPTSGAVPEAASLIVWSLITGCGAFAISYRRSSLV
jgi:hypothetical protein